MVFEGLYVFGYVDHLLLVLKHCLRLGFISHVFESRERLFELNEMFIDLVQMFLSFKVSLFDLIKDFLHLGFSIIREVFELA